MWGICGDNVYGPHLFSLHSQRKAQIMSFREEINFKKILDEIGGYSKPWWSWSLLKHEKLCEREKMEGVS